jgi:transposase
LEKDPYADIISQDEVHFMLGTLVTRGWYLTGSIPIVGSAPCKAGIPLSGFVSIKTGVTFVTSHERFTWESTIAAIRSFLKNYICKRGHKIYMILDNASWHKKAKRLIRDENNTEYADIREKVTFLDIPPYSPDLNPIEQLWRKARHEITHNRFFRSLPDLRAALANFFGKFVEPNEEIASLCRFNFEKDQHSSDKQLWIGMEYKLFRKNMAKRSVEAIIGPI